MTTYDQLLEECRRLVQENYKLRNDISAFEGLIIQLQHGHVPIKDDCDKCKVLDELIGQAVWRLVNV